jgi:hypothetical protein
MFIILHTCRSKGELEEAVNWCERNNIHLDAVNQNYPGIVGFADKKIFADVYIDDRAFGIYDDTAVINLTKRKDDF